MKRLLIMDTCTKTLGVALTEGHVVLAEQTIEAVQNHSKFLMPTIEAVIHTAKLTPSQLEGIVVAKGPGSYTGVRIGVTVAKTLAWTLKLPLYAISSLKGMALSEQNLRPFSGWLIPIIDARRNTVFTGAYRKKADGSWESKGDRHISFETWLRLLKEMNEPIRVIGGDVPLFQTQIEAVFGALSELPVFSLHVSSYVEAGTIDYLVDVVHDFVPEYLRLAEAEQKWMAKMKGGHVDV